MCHATSAVLVLGLLLTEPAAAPVFPGAAWDTRTPEEVGLARVKRDALCDLVGGRGCVVRH